ncbi:Ig-like domain-containing protein [Evansella cellulosilytica]|uniref:Ig-like domain-containing protein n=1 Tax=Evansella cellulosilytica (strain ATCC 21833 / DSM 2522 / FERM P-1141 / JCM 9156 / N-4) TaxID=649639 RepID=E6TRH7_EVAC2|nr:Ig-like domain-containing protein [Evansella cellulosilytica]ADU31807.1 hypothetical protein Bcell_3566 [Evansella cellulosilytica DSM 2522]
MTAKVMNYYKKNKYVKWITAVLLILSAVFISSSVFSLDGTERHIVYNEDNWEMSSQFDKEWYFFDNELTFDINLSEDYIESFDELVLPFMLEAEYNGVPLDESKISIEPNYIEVEVPIVPEVPEEDDHPDNGDSKEPEDPENGEEQEQSEDPIDTEQPEQPDSDVGEENSDAHEDSDELESNNEEIAEGQEGNEQQEDQQNSDGNNEEQGEENEQEENQNEEDTNEEHEEQEEQYETIQQFTGVYSVEVTLPANEDGKLDLLLQFNEDNEWNIPAISRAFYFERDTTAPSVSVINPDNLNGTNFESYFNVELLVEDKNITSDGVDINVFKNDEYIGKYWSVVEGDSSLTFEAEFDSDGDYRIVINAQDKLGNRASEKTIQFSINKEGVKWDFTDSDGIIENGGFSKQERIRFSATNGRSIQKVEIEISKDGVIEEVIEREYRGINTSASIRIDFSEDGEYVLKTTIIERDWPFNPGDTFELEAFHLTVDTLTPEVIVDGVEAGAVYNELPHILVQISDENIQEVNPASIKLEKNSEEYLSTEDFQKEWLEDGSVQYEFSFSETDEHDGVYELYVDSTDKAGNKSHLEAIPFTIDTTNPVIEITGVESNEYYHIPTVTFSVEDFTLDEENTSIVAKVMDGDDWVDYNSNIPYSVIGETRLEGEYTFTEDGVYQFIVTSTDLATNTSIDVVSFVNDTIAPTLSIEGVENGQEYKEPFDENNKVIIRAQDTNLDVSNTEVKVTRTNMSGETSEVSIDQLEIVNDTEAKNEYTFTRDGIYEINVHSTDKAGNESVHDTVRFTVDTQSPTINVSGVESGAHYNKDQDVAITVEDMTLDLENTDIIVLKDGEQYSNRFKEEKKSDRKVEYTHTFTEEGTYEVKVISIDRVGNEKTEENVKFVIDKTVPTISISGIDNKGFVQKGDVTIEVTERYFDTNNVEIKVEKDGRTFTDDRFEEWNNTGRVSRLTLPFDDRFEDGEYKIIVNATDKAGNKAKEETLRFTLDNTKPTISISDVERYSNKNQKVTVEVVEQNYENNNVTVEVTERNPVTKEVKNNYTMVWENTDPRSKKQYEFKEEFEYTVRVTATDAAGNKAEAKEVTFTIDKVKPQLQISNVENNMHYQSRTVNFRVTDTTIDLSKTNLRVTRNGNPYNDIGNFTMQSNSKTTATLSHHFKQEGNYVLRLESTDKAGNTATHETIAFVIDSTKPVVKIDGVDHNSFNAENKTVTISVDELNYATNNVELQVTKDGQPYQIGQWRNSGKVSRLSHTFADDGLYTIAITATDKAGNGPVTQNVTFTIDKTNPQIEITGVDNEAYYNTDRAVQVRITDRNLDINRVTVTRNGANYQVGGFTVNGNVASLNHNFSQEGTYVLQVEATDKAGNITTEEVTFTIDKTPPEITPMMSGENRVIENGEYINQIFTPIFALTESEDTIVSVTLNGSDVTGRIPTASRDMIYNYIVKAADRAGNETTLEISFTLDTTKPTLQIAGVVEGFFNKSITPEVTYSDTNLDTSRTSVTLNDEPFVNGTLLEEEMDYILRAVVTDLADNVSSRTIVFTIDKTAPTIRFTEPLSNQYFNSYVIPEFIIDSLSPYEILSITLNGRPYNLGDPIEEEGLHVLFFELRDSAGNITQLSVEFVIDMTPPVVVYEGVTSNEIYYDPIDLSIRLENPEDKIQSITINGELFSGEVEMEDDFEVIRTTISEINEYEVVVEAYDEAGNETVYTIPFEIAEKSILTKYYENTPLFAGSIVGLLGMISAGISVIVVRRKKAKKVEEMELED